MHDLPVDWSEQLQAAYPQRAGPSGWRGMKLMLALRRALMDSTWEQIIHGCKNYKAYCDKSGKTGSDFVQMPQRFIEDGSYLETFTYAIPIDPKLAEAEARKSERWERASVLAAQLSVPRYPQDSLEAFESRVELAATRGVSRAVPPGATGELSTRISGLAERLRAVK